MSDNFWLSDRQWAYRAVAADGAHRAGAAGRSADHQRHLHRLREGCRWRALRTNTETSSPSRTRSASQPEAMGRLCI
jgi:hypothetical protein